MVCHYLQVNVHDMSKHDQCLSDVACQHGIDDQGPSMCTSVQYSCCPSSTAGIHLPRWSLILKILITSNPFFKFIYGLQFSAIAVQCSVFAFCNWLSTIESESLFKLHYHVQRTNKKWFMHVMGIMEDKSQNYCSYHAITRKNESCWFQECVCLYVQIWLNYKSYKKGC